MTSPLRDAAESATAGVPVVRGLEWLDGVAIGAARIRYSVRAPSLTPGWRAWAQVLDARGGMPAGGAIITMAATDEADAKAICQADYEQRITAALNPDFLSELDTARAEIERLVAAIGDWARPTGTNGMTSAPETHPLVVAAKHARATLSPAVKEPK